MSDLRHILGKALQIIQRRGETRDDAEDIVQQAYLRVERYEQDHCVHSKEAMLVATAINLSIDGARRRKRAPFQASYRDIESIFDNMPGPEEIFEAKARLRHASKGLDRLSEKSRRILLARRLNNDSVAEIARRESMSTAAVEKQIARATFNLMKWMDGW